MAKNFTEDSGNPRTAVNFIAVLQKISALVLLSLFPLPILPMQPEVTPGVLNLTTFGLDPTGATDNTALLNNAIASVMQAGGGIIFGCGHYVILGQVLLPNSGGTLPSQKPIRLLGCGASPNTPEGPTNDPPYGGATLDLRYSGSGPSAIDTRGKGALEIAGWNIVNGGTGNVPFIQATNTALHIHDNFFYGSTSVTGQACNQDAIILGGTTTNLDGSATAAFQGYGTKIEGNNFSRIRRAVYLRVYANGVSITSNTVWASSGSPDTTAAAIDTMAGARVTGLYLAGNLVETWHYPYSIHLAATTSGVTMIGNMFYDPATPTLAYVKVDAGATNNMLIGGLADQQGGYPANPFIDSDGRNSFLYSLRSREPQLTFSPR